MLLHLAPEDIQCEARLYTQRCSGGERRMSCYQNIMILRWYRRRVWKQH